MGYLEGSLRDALGYPIVGAHIRLQSGKDIQQRFSDINGDFSFTLPAGKRYVLLVTHLMYQPLQQKVFLPADERLMLRLVMKDSVLMLNQISVMPAEEKDTAKEAGLVEIDVQNLHRLPAPHQEVSQLLSLLPGVVSGPGLSSTYSVRGGTYEENLVYIEGIPIYRVQVNNASEQEGLGLVNPALIERVSFSSGAWAPDRGDKLSSMLDVSYLRPTQNTGSLQWGLLGGSAHYALGHPTAAFTHLMAFRYKDTTSLLARSGISGQYRPVFFDAQYFMRFYSGRRDSAGRSPQTITLLANYARNRYRLFPQSQRITFGTLGRQLLFHVDLMGKVLLHHDTYQIGGSFSRRLSSRLRIETLHSYASSWEQQSTDLQGAYRLCNLLPPTEDQSIDDLCAEDIAVGRDIGYARNFLLGHATFHEVNLSARPNKNSAIKWGWNVSYDRAQDLIREYQYDYSDDYLTPLHAVHEENDVHRLLSGGYVQYALSPLNFLAESKMKGGLRWGYNHLLRELWLSPRLRFSFKRSKDAPTRYTLGTGWYYQPPFYRESRDITGTINTDLKAQRSFHLLGGGTHSFRLWARDFGFSYELYYKYLDRLIPYDQRDVFLQYYAANVSKGYAYGADFRFFGFFIPTEESWISLSLLNTAEDIQNDGQAYIRRPTDQRVSMGLFFRDYLPQFPAWQVSLRMLYGSGLPFNPPGEPAYRNQFNSGAYHRLDIGFSRTFFSSSAPLKDPSAHPIRDLTVTLEGLNLLGARQTISYSWVRTLNQQRFAVPNVYTGRFFNLKAELAF